MNCCADKTTTTEIMMMNDKRNRCPSILGSRVPCTHCAMSIYLGESWKDMQNAQCSSVCTPRDTHTHSW